jgi:hypothetical protein
MIPIIIPSNQKIKKIISIYLRNFLTYKISGGPKNGKEKFHIGTDYSETQGSRSKPIKGMSLARIRIKTLNSNRNLGYL